MNCLDHQSRVSSFRFHTRTLLSGLAAVLVLQPGLLRACAACYGQSDSPMAQGMNWGIMSLLAVIMVVLGCVAAFFVYLAKRAAAVAAETAAEPLLESASSAL
jgi:heme/copper-type cytochrome/quinol oxidase subunit 2